MSQRHSEQNGRNPEKDIEEIAENFAHCAPRDFLFRAAIYTTSVVRSQAQNHALTRFAEHKSASDSTQRWLFGNSGYVWGDCPLRSTKAGSHGAHLILS
ncbi:hypothetical protein AB4Y32_30585 [Paraburkholderia phymatum]|uniref:Uncharacterized protein n=1 Tax=Paraburkholderia phymatum TaxID=148447 RepID=A0ACC6U8T3_9BURK